MRSQVAAASGEAPAETAASRYPAAVIGFVRPPLLFLDVDGPLIPFGARSEQFPGGYPTYAVADAANPLLARVNPAYGPRLAALPCELVWATAWMADANEQMAPRLGLPQLPVVVWPESSDWEDQDERDGLHWKTRTLVSWAAGRPFTWVDDELTDTDRTWVATHHPGPSLLHHVDHREGLTERDFTTLDDWLRTV